MVDLKSQYVDLKKEIDQNIKDAVNSTAFINGPFVKSFEKNLSNYLDVEHVISCGNGTDALQIALMALELPKNSEIILPSFTYAATAEVIGLLGLTPVMVDVDPYTFNLTVSEIEKAITSNTKAIVPVHLYGQACDMEPILKLAEKHDLFVIEDNAQAIGASYTFSDGRVAKTGTIGHIGSTSFFPSKNLGCYGDGGAIFTNDDDLAHKIRGIVNHGMYIRYHHDVVGVNSRLDSIQAAVLDAKLPHLDNYNKARQNAARKYNAAFKDIENIEIPKTVNGCDSICDTCDCHVFHQYTLKVKNCDRDALAKHLNENDIPCGVYYPIPLHNQKAYQDSRYIEDNFKVTNHLVKEVISLPMHTELDDEQIEFITSKIIAFVKG